jgi:hypothetical protein
MYGLYQFISEGASPFFTPGETAKTTAPLLLVILMRNVVAMSKKHGTSHELRMRRGEM